MFPSFDIFKIDPDGRVLWCAAVESLVAAKTRIQRLAAGEYLILDQITDQRVLLVQPGVSTQAASQTALMLNINSTHACKVEIESI
jgi:hypothetical protein